jgi:PAS domain S-box-containing protein
VAFSIFLFSFSRHFMKYMQLCTSGVIMIAGLGIIQMILIAPYPGNNTYYAGLILVFIYGYTFFKLRFIWATLTGWIIVLAYEISAILLVETPFPIFLNNNFFFLAGNVIGMFACYSIELYSRKDFLKTRIIEAEKKSVSACNRELEKRVEERTTQLVNTNKELRQEVEVRKWAEESARENEQRFRCLSENSPEIIYTLANDGSFSYVNPAWEEILGHKIREVLGKYFIDFVRKKDTEKYVRRFKRIRDNKDTITNIIGTLIHKDGSYRIFNLSGAPNLDASGKVTGMVGLLKDITEQQNLQSKLIQAQKMEALGTLAGGVAHDFNNILMAVMGYSELAVIDISDNKKVGDDLQEVLRACQRAKDLVQQILTFSRQAEEKLKPMDLKPVVKEALKLLRASLPSTISIRRNIDSNTARVKSDLTQIHQLLMNLCTNAAHAMGDEGGQISVDLKNVTVKPVVPSPYLDLAPGRYLRLSVSDTGHGMPPQVLEKIFDPYFTTKEKGKGTGLGLAVVHGIVKRHRGHIAVESEQEKGTTFHIHLPIVEKSLDKEDITITKESFPGGNECILFVDDEKDVIEIGKRMLTNLGYQVVAKSNSLEVLDLFREQSEQFDLVITDMTMPNLTGDKLAEELIKIRSDIPIILYTGYTENLTKEQAKKIGIKNFGMKPFEMRDLAETTRKVLDEARQ